ncbi:MAG: SMI1/KNR4 family protein [Trichocoleus desertorum ATA4-8-CV12]|jgi:hypothetical protein|nr:SMI1/KNR4 family protein [Trichocoleus desertorum ATA4-8-CV12]
MSELTSALERIAAWYQENKPQFCPVFQPGLSQPNIDELVKDLGFSVPNEIYELYEWCNGCSLKEPIAFHSYYLLPLEQVVRLRKDKYGLNYGESWMQDDPSWFPVFKVWSTHAFLVIILGDKEKSLVQIYDPECENYNVRYESLTNLLLHSAKWLEAAKHHEKIGGFWEVERSIDAQLMVKYCIREPLG